jgi:hypothetical protein
MSDTTTKPRITHEVKSIRPAATIKDTLILMQNQNCAVTTLLRGGLRMTPVPGRWFSLNRLHVKVGENEIVIVCKAARGAGISISPLEAKPGVFKNTVVWTLQEIPL